MKLNIDIIKNLYTAVYLHALLSVSQLVLHFLCIFFGIYKILFVVSLAEIITNVDEVDLIMFNSISNQYKK